jgi:hypothetical protein
MIMEERSPPPFLSSKNAEPESNEWPARQTPEPVFRPQLLQLPQEKENPIDKLKSNPIILGILIGLVIGVVLTNMRPVIINPPK